ncbi:MAG: hypothetical protein LUC33_00545 [Prevotellaceae bacterium]|nr:hypothetical protein [Prevotellaceae bacterium]
MSEKKKEVTITLVVREMLYNVMQVAHKTGQAREADGTKNYVAASLMQASEDEEESYQIRRSLANNFAQMKSLLGEYLDEDETTANNRINTEIDNDGKLVLVFQMPSNYNLAGVSSMGENAHSYLVNITISEWFAITNPQEQANYATLAATALEHLKRAFYRRERPVRPTYDD